MATWIALSDRAAPPPPGPARPLMRGLMVFELALPLRGATILLDHRDRGAGGEQSLSLFYDPQSGISLLHRQGRRVVRHGLAGPMELGPGNGTARLSFAWDCAAGGPGAGRWSLTLTRDAGTAPLARTGGIGPLPLDPHLIDRLCRGVGGNRRHPALLWFGVTLGAAPPDRAPWIGQNTPVATPQGLIPAAHLRPGQVVMAGSGWRPLRAVHQMTLPTLGHYTPVRLRAPYFGATQDLLVSADQKVRLSGHLVEYLFGEDAVLCEARHLVDGRSALFDPARAVTDCLALEFDRDETLASDRVHLACGTAPLGLRSLHAYEALPLLTLQGRGSVVRAA